jgi:hypothetical protein
MGSYKIVDEANNTTSHVVDWVQHHPCLGEYVFDASGSQILVFNLDLPGDLYRICKAKPSELSIQSMRKTSGMPYWTS